MPILNPSLFFSNVIHSFHLPDTWLMILLKNRSEDNLFILPSPNLPSVSISVTKNSAFSEARPFLLRPSIHWYTELHRPSLIKAFWAYHPLSFLCIHKFSFSPWIHYLLSQNKNNFPGPLISLQLWYHFPAPLYRKTSQEQSVLLVSISSRPFSPSPIPITPSKYICHQWAPLC